MRRKLNRNLWPCSTLFYFFPPSRSRSRSLLSFSLSPSSWSSSSLSKRAIYCVWLTQPDHEQVVVVRFRFLVGFHFTNAPHFRPNAHNIKCVVSGASWWWWWRTISDPYEGQPRTHKGKPEAEESEGTYERACRTESRKFMASRGRGRFPLLLPLRRLVYVELNGSHRLSTMRCPCAGSLRRKLVPEFVTPFGKSIIWETTSELERCSFHGRCERQ